jgi:hypothetical protein
MHDQAQKEEVEAARLRQVARLTGACGRARGVRAPVLG